MAAVHPSSPSLTAAPTTARVQELYLAFNDISQLSPLIEADELQVLDLEANSIADTEQVAFLQFVPSLQELTLRGNPVADATTDLRETTFGLLPNLELLDDEPRDDAPLDAILAGEGDDAVDDDLLNDDFLNGEGVEEEAPPSPLPAASAPGGESSSAASGPATLASPARSPHKSPRKSSPSSKPPATPPGSDIFGPSDEGKRREEQLVSRGIKEAEVGRVYDVAADGRQMLTSASRAASRPATAQPVFNAWAGLAPGGGRGSSAGSDSHSDLRPGSALSERRLGTAIGSISSRPGSSVLSSRPVSSAFSRPFSSLGSSRLSSAQIDGAEADVASDLTGSSDVICGVHKLRAHKLRRTVEAMQRPASGESGEGGGGGEGSVAGAPSAPREPRPLEEELMDQLRAVKIQQLLAGRVDGEGESPSDESDSHDEQHAAVSVPVEEMSMGEADMLRLETGDEEPPRAAPMLSGYDEGEALDVGDEEGSSAAVHRSARPSSSKEVTPTQTPAVAGGTGSAVPNPIGPPIPPSQPAARVSPNAGGKRVARAASPGRRVKEVGGGPHTTTRMSSKGGEGGPPVLRHLRMPDEKGLADAAAEILSL